MADLDSRLTQRLAKSTKLVDECQVAYDELLEADKDLQRRKLEARRKLDAARAQQQRAVYDALQAGASPTAIARQYGLSSATVHKYGQSPEAPPARDPATDRRRRPRGLSS